LGGKRRLGYKQGDGPNEKGSKRKKGKRIKEEKCPKEGGKKARAIARGESLNCREGGEAPWLGSKVGRKR